MLSALFPWASALGGASILAGLLCIQDTSAVDDGPRPAAAARSRLAAELEALLPREATLGSALADARETGRKVLVVATADPAPEGGGLSFQERAVAGVLLADPRIADVVAERYVVLPRKLDPAGVRAAVRAAYRDAPGGARPAPTAALDGLEPPAFAVLDLAGRVERARGALLPSDPGAVGAWLEAGGEGPERARIPIAEGDDAGAAYLTLARQSRADATLGLQEFLSEHIASPWFLKARARVLDAEATAAYERLSAGETSLALAELIEAARLRLREAQQPDGSFPGTAACSAEANTTAAFAALHAVGDHDAAELARAWLADRPASDALLAALRVDAFLLRYSAGWSTSEEVVAAAVALHGLRVADGSGWPSGGAFSSGWRASDSLCPVHTGFAVDVLQRVAAAGIELPEDVDCARAVGALLASRGDGDFAALPPSPIVADSLLPQDTLKSSAGARGTTLAADGALLRAEALRTRDVVVSLEAFLGELPDLAAAGGIGGMGARHPAITGELRMLALLSYARASNAVTQRRMLKRNGRVIRTLIYEAGRDGTWIDAPEQGWVVPTSLALLVLDALE